MGDTAASEATLIRWQALSGLCFATFLVLHLANTMVGALGEGAYNAWQGAMRWYYQFPPVEIVAVGVSATVHAVCGLRRMLRRRAHRKAGRPLAAPRWLVLHRMSGYFLLFVIVGHVLATRGPGLFEDMPAEFAYLRFSLTTWPWMMWPYYFLLMSCGVYHLLHGGLVALSIAGLRTGPPTGAWARGFLAVALLAGAAGVLSMGGVWGEASEERYPDYRAFYEEYTPFMRNW